MEQCLIAGCPNEAKLIAKGGGKLYYSCKEHRKDVVQIIGAEHTKSEKERIEAQFSISNLKNKKEIPKWMKF